MAQRNIDFGSFPDDPDADAIRTAFQKTQENFTELFSAANTVTSGVTSINRTPGMGVTVFPITGEVSISANIACVQISTTSLALGIGGPAANTYVNISNSSQVIYVDLPNSASFSGNLVAKNITANSNIVGNTGNFTTINTTTANAANINANLIVANTANLSNINSNTFVANTITANTSNIANINSNIIIANIANLANVTSNILVANTANVPNINSDVITANTANVPNINTSTLVVNTSANLGSVSNIKITGGSSGQLLTTDGNGNLSWSTSSSGVTSVGITPGNGISVSGSPVTTTGNITVVNTGVTSVTGTNGLNTSAANGDITLSVSNTLPNLTQVGTLTSLNVSGNVAFSGANVSLGAVGNIKITGGSSGQLLTTDGNGNLSWSTSSSGVTSINTGTGLTGGPITTTGTISLANTTVTAGTYTYPNITIDAQGRITAATSIPQTRTISFGGANILNSEVLVVYRSTSNMTLPANFSTWVAGFDSNPSANFVLDVLNDTTQIGTVTIAANGAFIGNTTGGTSKVINTNTTLIFRAPSNAQTVAANLTFSISAIGTI